MWAIFLNIIWMSLIVVGGIIIHRSLLNEKRTLQELKERKINGEYQQVTLSALWGERTIYAVHLLLTILLIGASYLIHDPEPEIKQRWFGVGIIAMLIMIAGIVRSWSHLRDRHIIRERQEARIRLEQLSQERGQSI